MRPTLDDVAATATNEPDTEVSLNGGETPTTAIGLNHHLNCNLCRECLLA